MKLVTFHAPSATSVTTSWNNMNVALVPTKLPIFRESLPESAHYHNSEAESILRRDMVADVRSVGRHEHHVVQVNDLRLAG